MTVSAVVADGEDVTRYDDPIAARDTPGTAWVRVAEGTDEEIAQVADTFEYTRSRSTTSMATSGRKPNRSGRIRSSCSKPPN